MLFFPKIGSLTLEAGLVWAPVPSLLAWLIRVNITSLNLSKTETNKTPQLTLSILSGCLLKTLYSSYFLCFDFEWAISSTPRDVEWNGESMIFRWIDHGADVQNYKSSSHKHEFWPTAEMSSSLYNSNKVIEPVWALITCLKMKDANSYWKSCHEHFWSLGLCWSLGNLVANPASGTIDMSTVSARKSLKSMWTETWKLPTPHKPQFLSLKRIRETHAYSSGLFYWKI